MSKHTIAPTQLNFGGSNQLLASSLGMIANASKGVITQQNAEQDRLLKVQELDSRKKQADRLFALDSRKQDFVEGANDRALQLLKDQNAYKQQQGVLLGKDLSNATRDTILAASMNPDRLRNFQQGKQWANPNAIITEQDRARYAENQWENPSNPFSLQELANNRKNGEFINNVIQGNIANPRNTVDPDTLKANVRQAALANGLSLEDANKQAELAYKDTFNIMDKDLVKSMMPTGTAKLKGGSSSSSSSNSSKGRGLAEFSKGIEIEKSLDETLSAYDKDIWQTLVGTDKNLGDFNVKNLYKSEINKLAGALSARNLKSPYVKKALINIVEGGTLPTVTNAKGETRQLRMEELANDEGFIASVAALQNSFEGGGAGSSTSTANYNASVLAQQQANAQRVDSLARSTYFNGATAKQQDKQFQDAANSFYGDTVLSPNKANKIAKTRGSSTTPNTTNTATVSTSALDNAKQNNPNHVDKSIDKKVKKTTADEAEKDLTAASKNTANSKGFLSSRVKNNNSTIGSRILESTVSSLKKENSQKFKEEYLYPEQNKVILNRLNKESRNPLLKSQDTTKILSSIRKTGFNALSSNNKDVYRRLKKRLENPDLSSEQKTRIKKVMHNIVKTK